MIHSSSYNFISDWEKLISAQCYHQPIKALHIQFKVQFWKLYSMTNIHKTMLRNFLFIIYKYVQADEHRRISILQRNKNIHFSLHHKRLDISGLSLYALCMVLYAIFYINLIENDVLFITVVHKIIRGYLG